MTPHNDYYHWIVFDWIVGGGINWLGADEDAERFLLVTIDERRWISDATPLSLPKEGFVLVILLNDQVTLGEEDFDIDKLVRADGTKLPAWCHYGGPVDLKNMKIRWRSFSWLSPSLRDKLTKRLPDPYPYPMPISDSHPLPWDIEWQEARESIRSYDPSKWNELIVKLNKLWKMATLELRVNAAVAARNRWINAAQAIESLQSLLTREGDTPTIEQLQTFLEEAKSLRLTRLGERASDGEMEDALSAKFEAAINAIGTLPVALGRVELDQVKDHVNSIRTSLQEFLDAYEGKQETHEGGML